MSDEAPPRRPEDEATGADELTSAGTEITPSAIRGQGGHLSASEWKTVAVRTYEQFKRHDLIDFAAALTYFGVLSIFPGLLVLVSVLRVFGSDTAQKVVTNISGVAPGSTGSTINSAVDSLQASSSGSAVTIVVIGTLGALWSASAYVGSFMRTANVIYEVPEGRPIWKTIPIRIGLTVLAGVTLTVAAFTVIFTGAVARHLGDAIGLGSAAVTAWDIAKWPVLIVIVSLLLAVMYWSSPNAKIGRFRFVSAGSLLAVVGWLIASGLFGFYVANFGSYNRVYGSIASVIVFLIWLWITNIAILLGAQLDAEVGRLRATRSGVPASRKPYVELRDVGKAPDTSATPAG
jgi:membrane protein